MLANAAWSAIVRLAGSPTPLQQSTGSDGAWFLISLLLVVGAIQLWAACGYRYTARRVALLLSASTWIGVEAVVFSFVGWRNPSFIFILGIALIPAWACVTLGQCRD